MPNWTSNIVRAEGAAADLREFLERVRGPTSALDFNRIIPMPALLKHTGSGGRTIEGKRVTSWYVIDPDALLPTDEQVRLFTPEEGVALADIGYANWYDWSVEHWGTKWNASRVRVEEGAIAAGAVEIMFETAWAAPVPIFRKLASMFPGIRLEFTWTDEDEPHATHTVVLRAGEQP